ncbi:hypothetical protein DNX69_10440 [Rhodopseudomonas palustris]|uniref:HTH luxR-type domain-containing protein n=1 Tax=Rhodopseudomonas palustris TaxID=1076 RepID=A0A323UJU2_RHOPL|nr:helix-turn-helix transcriptional regulator [Rhodopseudomonas palustris]PZA12393.1 hypothetical protein DNX69_10440 [Rhodopseudomonas palustris]
MTLPADYAGLVDRIYEAALVPQLWPELLGALSAISGGERGVLFAVRDGYSSGIVSPGWEDQLQVFMRDWAHRDPLLSRAQQKNHAGFLTDLDLVSADLIATHPIYREFYRPSGMGYRAGTLIPIPSGDVISILLPRHHDLGPVPPDVVHVLDELRPHMARAAMTANRIGFERAKAQTDAIQALGLPGAVLRGAGRVFAANALFDALVPAVFQDRAQRLTIADRSADAVFAEAVAALPSAPAVRSIPVAASQGNLPLVLHLIPVRGSARDVFTQAIALLVATPVDRARVPTADVLQGLFDLTPAEARVARGIGEAHSVDAVATALGVSRETVRSQLKEVLSKTGLSRQQELISLLAGKAVWT